MDFLNKIDGLATLPMTRIIGKVIMPDISLSDREKMLLTELGFTLQTKNNSSAYVHDDISGLNNMIYRVRERLGDLI